MNREAVKFDDLDGFMSVMEQNGFGPQARSVIYEKDRLPYCSAYLIPVELLPATLTVDHINRFGGRMTHVREINYIGTERFYTDFMVYPLSRTGYVEIEASLPTTFAPLSDDDWDMVYVVNLEDGGGQEFFLTTEGGLAVLSAGQETAQEFKDQKAVSKKISELRPRYPASCQLYAVERGEFDQRRKALSERGVSE